MTFIIVNYKSERCILNCLASIYDKTSSQTGFEIIIVNNDKGEKLEKITENYPEVKVTHSGENIGFGAANNAGAQLASREYLAFLNPDVEILSSNTEAVLEEFKKDGSIGVIGGRLITPEGEVQKWCAGREINMLDLIRNNLGFPSGRKIWRSEIKREADWVAGTALFIPKKLFDQVGGFDESFFMYFEDVDLCKRIRNLGKKVFYFPKFCVCHRSGGSYKDEKIQKKDYYNSQEYYFKKHFGVWAMRLVKIARKFNFS